MEKLRDEGAGRRDVPQHVSGSDLWPSSTGMHLRAQPFDRCLTSEPDNESKPTQDDARSCPLYQQRTLAQKNKSLARNNKTSAEAPVKGAAAMRNNDYYVVTSRSGEHPVRWSWEIRRKSKPLGVRLLAHGFQSDSAAQIAGKRALDEFLSALSEEEQRRS